MKENFKQPLFRKIINVFISEKELDYPSIHRWYFKKYKKDIPEKVSIYLKVILSEVYENNDLDCLGNFLFKTMIKQQLINIHNVLNKHVDTNKIEQIIFILSLPRTGSTYLHQTICHELDVNFLSFWEQNHLGNYKFKFLKKIEGALMLFIQDLLVPELKYIHKVYNEGPEECSKILLSTFITQIYPLIFKMPKYYDLLKNESYDFTYSFHKKALLLRCQDNNKPMVLKAPMHLQSIEKIIEYFPNAKFLFIHRDINKVIPSSYKLALEYKKLFLKSYDPKYLQNKLIDKLSTDLKKTIEYIQNHNLEIQHIEYKSFIENPINTIKIIKDNYKLNYRDKRMLEKAQLKRKQIYPNIAFDGKEFNSYNNYLESLGLDKNL